MYYKYFKANNDTLRLFFQKKSYVKFYQASIYHN